MTPSYWRFGFWHCPCSAVNSGQRALCYACTAPAPPETRRMMSDGSIVENERVPVSVEATQEEIGLLKALFDGLNHLHAKERIPPRKSGGDWITANKKEVKPVPLKRREIKPLPEGLDPDKIVDVCSKCLMACCWQGVLHCQDYRYASIIKMTVQELWELGKEHWNYWK